MDLKKVVIVGPECTGKSDLSAYLAREFRTVWVKEYAREYIDALSRPYEQSDLVHIARGQLAAEDALAPEARDVLICDTDLHVIKVWSLFKYGECDPQILRWISMRKYDLYLLTYIDIPWVYDPQREHPNQRQALYETYLHEMENQPVPFVEIRGSRAEREALARESVRRLLSASR